MVRTRALAVAVTLLALAAGCSDAADEQAVAPAVVPGVPPAAAAAPAAAVASPDPLTGVAPVAVAPVVVLKVDNAQLARPYQRGLDRAAIVYQELVEGGSTRLVAVFTGAPDIETGPVRSVRESDVELLQQYGPVALGFSGGQAPVVAIVRKAVGAGRLTDASYDAVPGAYRLAEQRADARNFFTNPATIAALRPGAGKARDTGLRFGPASATAGAVPVASVSASFVQQTSTVVLTWVPATGSWRVSQDGKPVNGVAPANVVIQRVVTRSTKYKDVHGLATPYTVSTGKGAATVLRDGTKATGTWSRPAAADGTRLLDAAGNDLVLKPGPTWWLLLPTTGSVTVG